MDAAPFLASLIKSAACSSDAGAFGFWGGMIGLLMALMYRSRLATMLLLALAAYGGFIVFIPDDDVCGASAGESGPFFGYESHLLYFVPVAIGLVLTQFLYRKYVVHDDPSSHEMQPPDQGSCGDS